MRVDPKRILYVQPNNEVGGSDIALLRTIRELDRTLYAPVVVLPYDGPLSEHLLAVGAELHFAPMKQLRTLPSPRYQASYLAQFAPAVRRIQTSYPARADCPGSYELALLPVWCLGRTPRRTVRISGISARFRRLSPSCVRSMLRWLRDCRHLSSP